ncbi:MAG: hypothetical protein M2R45_04232 [Verrucomicrobia subdivision 3 bacterium]|nr:hypothetical protein [Limisphaerales bacterium]MCS1412643.1 hypothetical protein [Limisphaerales bacterium]
MLAVYVASSSYIQRNTEYTEAAPGHALVNLPEDTNTLIDSQGGGYFEGVVSQSGELMEKQLLRVSNIVVQSDWSGHVRHSRTYDQGSLPAKDIT